MKRFNITTKLFPMNKDIGEYYIPRNFDEMHCQLINGVPCEDIEVIKETALDLYLWRYEPLGIQMRVDWKLDNSKTHLRRFMQEQRIYKTTYIVETLLASFWHFLHHKSFLVSNWKIYRGYELDTY